MPALKRPHHCRFCRQPLSRLEQLRGAVCRQLDCRRAAVLEQQQAQREADLEARRASRPELALAPIVWLQAHATRLIRLRAAERQAQQAHLQGLVEAEAAPAAAAPVPPSTDGRALPGAVCGFCGGRCCREGAYRHAFIDRAMLQRWVLEHPGRTLHDAAAAYAAQLPAQHVQGSCLYHGRTGCTLPRTMRSAICNGYACAGLERAREVTAERLIVAMPGRDGVQRAAWADAAGPHPLPRRRSAAAAPQRQQPDPGDE